MTSYPRLRHFSSFSNCPCPRPKTGPRPCSSLVTRRSSRLNASDRYTSLDLTKNRPFYPPCTGSFLCPPPSSDRNRTDFHHCWGLRRPQSDSGAQTFSVLFNCPPRLDGFNSPFLSSSWFPGPLHVHPTHINYFSFPNTPRRLQLKQACHFVDQEPAPKRNCACLSSFPCRLTPPFRFCI